MNHRLARSFLLLLPALVVLAVVACSGTSGTDPEPSTGGGAVATDDLVLVEASTVDAAKPFPGTPVRPFSPVKPIASPSEN